MHDAAEIAQNTSGSLPVSVMSNRNGDFHEDLSDKQMSEVTEQTLQEVEETNSIIETSTIDKKRSKVLTRGEAVHEDCSPTPLMTEEISEELPKNDEKHLSSSSKESSTETYTDFTGTDLQQFLADTLQKNVKDRVHLLRMEQELINLVVDEDRHSHKFPPMSSYHRMLIHRVAAFFGLDHNIDESGTQVIVIKQKGITRIPEFRFKDQFKNSSAQSLDEPRAILKRDTVSFDEFNKPIDRRSSSAAGYSDLRKCKSFEEREEQYEKARARIFNQEQNEAKRNESIYNAMKQSELEINGEACGSTTNQTEDKQSASNAPKKCLNSATSSLERSTKVKSKNNEENGRKFITSKVNGEKTQKLEPKNYRHMNHNVTTGSSSSSKYVYKTKPQIVSTDNSMLPASLLPYPPEVLNNKMIYPNTFSVPYLDYTNPSWLSMGTVNPQDHSMHLQQPNYPQTFFHPSNPEYFHTSLDNRTNKCGPQMYFQPTSGYYPPMATTHEAQMKVNAYDKNQMNSYLPNQMASLCLSALSSNSYMMGESPNGASVPLYYFPPSYPMHSQPISSDLTHQYANGVISYASQMPSAHSYAHQATANKVIMMPTMSSSGAPTAFTSSGKPVFTSAMSTAPVPPPASGDSFMKMHSYTFPMQSHTSHSGLHQASSSVRMHQPVASLPSRALTPPCFLPHLPSSQTYVVPNNKSFRPQQSPLLPTPQQNQNVPNTLSASQPFSSKHNALNGNGYQSARQAPPFVTAAPRSNHFQANKSAKRVTTNTNNTRNFATEVSKKATAVASSTLNSQPKGQRMTKAKDPMVQTTNSSKKIPIEG